MALKVHVWHGQLGQVNSGSWVYGSFAIAVNNMSELRAACRDVGLHRPAETYGPKSDPSLAEAALGQPGVVLFKETEQGSDGSICQVQPTK